MNEPINPLTVRQASGVDAVINTVALPPLRSRSRSHYEDLLAKLASLETFQHHIQECETPERIFAVSSEVLRRLAPFSQLGFWLVDAQTHEFTLNHCDPGNADVFLKELALEEIAAGTFAWALRQSRAVVVTHPRTGKVLFLSGLATRARTVGMVIGVLEADQVRAVENARDLLSLVFLALTYTLENFQLLAELQEYNDHLQEQVEIRTSEVIKKSAALEREEADRRRVQSELNRSEHRYQAVVLALDDGVVLLDLEGRVMGCNPSAARILGVSEEALCQVPRFDQRWKWLEEEGDPLNPLALSFQKTMKTGVAEVDKVFAFYDDQGAMRWIHLNAQPLQEEGETRHHGVILSFSDITEKRQAQENLAKSEERFRNALDAAEDGLWDWNVKENRSILSRRCFTMLGYEADAFEPTWENWKGRIHPDDIGVAMERLERHFRGDLPLYEAEYRMKTKAGGWKWILARGRVVSRDDHGRPLRMVGLYQDTTERRLGEEQLRHAKAVAESADRAKSDFLAMMSHELRTPMNGIIGFTNLLAGTAMTQEQRDFVQLVGLSSKQLLSLLNDLLDFSKIEAGQLVLEKHAFSVRQLLDEVIDLTAGQAKEKDLALCLRVEETLPDQILGDSTRLRQILLNLVGNAIKFTERGHVTLLLRSPKPEAKEKGTFLSWSVEDSGIGIPLEKQGALFQPFIQADSSTTRKYGGTGLGLAICRRLCEAMGGRIWLESEEGVGSRFHFLTPLEEKGRTVPPQKMPIGSA